MNDWVTMWLDRLARPRPRLEIERPCTLGDGIDRIDPARFAALEAVADSVSERLSGFVPASGAATRMGLKGPKALVPFHRYPSGWKTAYEEQCAEAQALAAHRVHFTVPPGSEPGFRQLPVPLPVSLSVQDASTNLPALEADGRPVRRGSELVLRPGGHGALLANLEADGGDLVAIKNIDNVVHADHRAEVVRWRKRLIGRLVELESDHSGPEPLRVCGMVAHRGEPGGGPFWVDGRVQIVEKAQILPDQQPLLDGSTHFNPVDLVCSLRGRSLADYAEPGWWIRTEKSHEGRPIRAIELPGLWNGGMAYWKTVFVEVPARIFQPVKGRDDLQRPAHQPA